MALTRQDTPRPRPRFFAQRTQAEALSSTSSISLDVSHDDNESSMQRSQSLPAEFTEQFPASQKPTTIIITTTQPSSPSSDSLDSIFIENLVFEPMLERQTLNQRQQENLPQELRDRLTRIHRRISLHNRNSRYRERFDRHHECSSSDDDPLFGIFEVRAGDMAGYCCSQKKLFYDLMVGHDNAHRLFTLTKFGRQLNELAVANGHTGFVPFFNEFFKFSYGPKADFSVFLASTPGVTDEDRVEWYFGECSVCLSSCRFVRKPQCCRKAICQPCWSGYVRNHAKSSINLTGVYNLHCYSCAKLVPFSQALSCTENAEMELIRPKLLGANTSTRCPDCLEPAPPLVTNIDETNPKKQEKLLKKLRKTKGGHPHPCQRCEKVFCRFCGTSNHERFTCEELTVAEAGLQTWARQKNSTRPDMMNGRRCPNCHIAVSHNGGCPHMTCPCGTEFCYLCGRKYFKRLLAFQAFHTSSKIVPLLTCPKQWKSQPKRILVHSLVGFGVVAAGIPLMAIAVPILVPIVGGAIAIKRIRRRF